MYVFVLFLLGWRVCNAVTTTIEPERGHCSLGEIPAFAKREGEEREREIEVVDTTR